MVRLKLDPESGGLSSLFERITGARVKDCFQDDYMVYFVVMPGDLGRAIGREGSNLHKVQAQLGKRVKVVEFRDEVCSFVRNIIHPIKVQEIVEEGEMVVIKDGNYQSKSLIIGREGKNLKIINRAVQRFFGKSVVVK